MELKITKPSYLNKGDTLLIISPAKAIAKNYIDLAVALFEGWGLHVEIGSHALDAHHYFGGKDIDRAKDLQWALDHPTAKAIVTARGGYGSIRIVDEVDYTGFMRNPKWLVGFSDVTVFHNKLHGQLNIASIHAAAPLYFDQLSATDATLTSLKSALFGYALITEVPVKNENRTGFGKGILVGGNLAILCSLIGTSLDISMQGKILFFEEVSEYAYRFDRMLWSLKKAGKFDGLSGLIIGGLTDMKQSEDTFGCAIEELVNDVVGESDFPILFNYPAGHQLNNQALVLGAEYHMEVTAKKATVTLKQNGGA